MHSLILSEVLLIFSYLVSMHVMMKYSAKPQRISTYFPFCIKGFWVLRKYISAHLIVLLTVSSWISKKKNVHMNPVGRIRSCECQNHRVISQIVECRKKHRARLSTNLRHSACWVRSGHCRELKAWRVEIGPSGFRVHRWKWRIKKIDRTANFKRR